MRGKKGAHLPIVTSGPAGAEGLEVACACSGAARASRQAVCLCSWAWDKDGTSAMREFGGHTGVRRLGAGASFGARRR